MRQANRFRTDLSNIQNRSFSCAYGYSKQAEAELGRRPGQASGGILLMMEGRVLRRSGTLADQRRPRRPAPATSATSASCGTRTTAASSRPPSRPTTTGGARGAAGDGGGQARRPWRGGWKGTRTLASMAHRARRSSGAGGHGASGEGARARAAMAEGRPADFLIAARRSKIFQSGTFLPAVEKPDTARAG
jgi:hypothetical protein